MKNSVGINVNFEGPVVKDLMSFVIDTQNGKYTKEKPILNHVTYKRLDLDAQDFELSFDEPEESIILFGVSN